MSRLIKQDLEILTKKSKKFDHKTDSYIFSLLEEELKHHQGVGIAAVQIGILTNAFIVKHNEEILKFANPVLVSTRLARYQVIEGCLSFPKEYFIVERYPEIVLKDDINGEKVYSGYLAQIIQHEYDHIKGITLKQSGKIIS